MTIVTLLTDFGPADSYVAEVRATLLSLAPHATLVDISHAVPPGDIAAGAYVLARAWPRFPAGTVHLAIVDPGVGTERAGLAMRGSGHWFVGPDNGLLPSHPSGAELVELPIPPDAAATFHGRDLFAPAAARLALGARLAELGAPLARSPIRLETPQPHHEGKTLVGEVIYVDRFGTLVTNFTAANLPDYAVLEVETGEIGRLRRTFGDVPTGGLVAYVGSGGNVEVAVRDGSATRRLGLGVGGKVRARLG